MGWAARTAVQGAGVKFGGSARGLRSVAVDVLDRGLGSVAGPEVGAVTAEHVDPLGACFFEGLRDEVGDVAVAAAVMPTYPAAAPVPSPISRCAWSTVSP